MHPKPHRRSFVIAAAAAVVLAVILARPGLGGDAEAPAVIAARIDDPTALRIGERLPDVAVETPDGSRRPLSSFAGRAGLLVVARSESCPVGRRYGPSLAAIEKEAAARGVGVVYLNVAKGDLPAVAVQAAKDYGIAAPYAFDPDRSAAAALRLRSTTECVLIDRARTVVYRGAADDQYGVGVSRASPRETWVLDALAALAADRRPRVEATTAPGCALVLPPAVDPSAAAAPEPAPTWHARVGRIFDRHCADCHRAGESGPFPLVSAKDASDQADMIRQVVANRTMPPWFATPESGPFANDARLSDRDRGAVLAWIDAGCPQGDAAETGVPAARVKGWRIGEPDLVLEVERETAVPAHGVVDYEYRWVKASFPEDRWIRAFEVRPSAPEVVHHILVFARFRKSDPRARSQGPFDGGLTGFFAAMVPGAAHVDWGAKLAKKLPAGMDLYFQIHYTPNGKAVKDRPKIGLVFAKGPPEREVRTRGIFDARFVIPPGAARHEVAAVWTFQEPGTILEFMPHMHLRGTAFRYELELADGTRRTLLDIPRFAFDWQLVHRLREPIDVPRGARLHATGWFDNSAANPHNPDPSQTVVFGEQTSDEMMIGYVDWSPLAPPPK